MEDLVNGLFNFFIGIFSIIIGPIQTLIDENIPSLNDFANNIGPFFSIINSSWIPWIKDLLFVPAWVFDLALGYILFKFMVAITINVVKLVMKYWNVLVP